MPQTSTSLLNSITVTYSTEAPDQRYSYAVLALLDDIEDAAQLKVQWEVSGVTRVSDGAAINPEQDLSALAADLVYTLDPSLYTVNATDDTVLIDSAVVSGTTVTVEGEVYLRGTLTGSNFAIAPIRIERATNIDDPLVEYQPGSRLSHNSLNSNSDQAINALQELMVEVEQLAGNVGVVDLSVKSINDLGDVVIDQVGITTGELIRWDGSNWVNVTLTEAGVPLTFAELADTDMTTAAPQVNDTIVWDGTQWLPGTPVSTLDSLSDVYIPFPPTTGDSLVWDGANWINSAPVSSFAGLTDVDMTGLADNQIARYDATTGNWLPDTDVVTTARATERIEYAQSLNRPVGAQNVTLNLLDHSEWDVPETAWAVPRWTDNIADGLMVDGTTGPVWTAPAPMKLNIGIGFMMASLDEKCRARVIKNGSIVWSANLWEDIDGVQSTDIYQTQYGEFHVEVTTGDVLELHIMPGSTTFVPTGTIDVRRAYYNVSELSTDQAVFEGTTLIQPPSATILQTSPIGYVRTLAAPTVVGVNTDMSLVDTTNLIKRGAASLNDGWTAGVWTAPEAGHYRFQYALSGTPATDGPFLPYLGFKLNGAYRGTASYQYSSDEDNNTGQGYNTQIPMADEEIVYLEAGDTCEPVIGCGATGSVDIEVRYWECRIQRLDFKADVVVDGVNMTGAILRPTGVEADSVDADVLTSADGTFGDWTPSADNTPEADLDLKAHAASINRLYLGADESELDFFAGRTSTGSDGRTISEGDRVGQLNPFGYLYLYDTARQGTASGPQDDWILLNPKRTPGSGTDTKIKVQHGGRTGLTHSIDPTGNIDRLTVQRTQGNNDDYVRFEPSGMSQSATNVIHAYDNTSAANRFYVRGDGSVYGRAYNLTSDATKKDYSVEEEAPDSISEAFAALGTLGTYVWNDTDDSDAKRLYGPTAQDLQEVGLGVMIDSSPDSEGDVLLQINTSSSLGLLMAAVKELTEKNAELTSRIEALEGGA
ncbi:MAG: hypothetical protein GY871_08120 [Actinomycetales bacterium]|nr:hypothetical protein [Actinomycetales bacterium]